MLTNKKVLKGGVILTLLTAVVGLASCTDVEASLTPEEEETPLLALDGIDNNTMQQIYDATITSGDSNSEKVLNNVLLILAKNQLGSFYDTVDEDGKAVKGLFTLFCATEKDSEGHNVPKPYDSSKDADVNAVAKNSEAISFLKAYKSAYYGTDVEETDITSAMEKEAIKKAIIYTNFLLERINRTFMSYTDDATYCDDSRFFEELFYQYIQKDLWDLEDVKDSEFKGVKDGKSVGVATGESQLSYDANSRYGTDYVINYFQDNYLEVYEDYINRSLLPNILRKGLVQQYLMDNNYSSFGRSSARNLQYISVSDNSEYPSAIRNLVKAYADLVLNEKLESTYLDAIKDYYNTYSYDLHFLNDLVKGYTEGWSETLKEAADKVYAAAQFTSITVDNKFTAYQETTYGGYLTDYAKITDNRFTNDTTVENDFTNSGKYTPEVGLQKKTDGLNSVDKTVCGWYNDSGLTSLPATYKTRLFKVTVANDLANGEDGIPTYGTWVKGHYYLTRTTYQADDEFPYLIYDEDSSTWYIIRVDEAVKSSRMKKGTETDGTYDHDKGTAYRYDIERQISWILADNSTYTKSANQYYVEQAMVYDHLHDDYVYDYFEETFPDLFD